MNDGLIVLASLILVPSVLLGGLYAAHCYEENRREQLRRLKAVVREAERLCDRYRTFEGASETEKEVESVIEPLVEALRHVGHTKDER